MNFQQTTKLPANIHSWTNDNSQIPLWVREKMISEIAANGTFLVETPIGAARVHVGNVVIKHSSGIWSRSSNEILQFIEGLDAENLPAVAAVGPGKSAQYGTKRKTKNQQKHKTERKRTFRPAIGYMPSIEWVHTSELTVDQSYQRSTDNEGSRRLIASIAANFDWRLCAPLVVSRRADGSKVIIDGQHRWAAAALRGDLLQLPCCLFTYANPEDEAKMFIVANRARKPINRLDDFQAAVAAADEDALEILRLVTDAGLTIAKSTSSSAWRPGQVAFTSSIAMALRRHDEAIVSAALTCIAEAFEGQAVIQGASLFGGLIEIFARPPEGFDPDKLAIALQMFDVAGWGSFVRDQKGGEARTVAMHSAILKIMAKISEDALRG